MKQNSRDEDNEFEELLEDDDEDDEMNELEDEDVDTLPQVPRKISHEAAKKLKAVEKAKAVQQQESAPKKTQVPQVRSSQAQAKQVAPRRFAAVKQPERIAVIHADTGEVIAEDIPMWAAQMWADLKNDIDELKSAVGNM